MGEDVSKLKMCVLSDEDGNMTELPAEIPTIIITAFDGLSEAIQKAAKAVDDFVFEARIGKLKNKKKTRNRQLIKLEKMYSKAFYSGHISCERYCSLVLKISIKEMLYK